MNQGNILGLSAVQRALVMSVLMNLEGYLDNDGFIFLKPCPTPQVPGGTRWRTGYNGCRVGGTVQERIMKRRTLHES